MKDDRGAEDIHILLGVPQKELDSSVGQKEDFNTYAELRGSSRMSLSHMGPCTAIYSVTASLSLHMHGGYHMNVPQKVQIDFECAESDDNVRFIPVPQDTANVRSQPKISSISNNRHVLIWATKYACARVHQTFLEGEDGQSNPTPGDEETNHPPKDSEEPSPNQDLVYIPPNIKGTSIRAVVVWSG